MAKKKEQTLPQTLYGRWNDDTDDVRYVMTDDDPAALVDKNETRRVGVYELVGYAVIENKTTNTTKQPKGRRR